MIVSRVIPLIIDDVVRSKMMFAMYRLSRKWKVALLLCVLFLMTLSAASAEEKKPVRITPSDVERAIALKEREDKVAKQEIKINKKEEEVVAIKKEVDQKLERLVALQNEIKGQLDELKAIQDKEFKNLIKVYSAMSASKIAPLLNKMDETATVKILRAMKSDLVSKIIPKLDQDKAVSISKKLGLMDQVQ